MVKRRRTKASEEEVIEEQKTPKITKSVSLVSRTEEVDGHDEEYDLEVEHFVHEHPAFVRVRAEQKRALADYENVTVSISVSIPCYKEEIEKVLTEASEMVSERLNDELDFYMGEESGEDED